MWAVTETTSDSLGLQFTCDVETFDTQEEAEAEADRLTIAAQAEIFSVRGVD